MLNLKSEDEGNRILKKIQYEIDTVHPSVARVVVTYYCYLLQVAIEKRSIIFIKKRNCKSIIPCISYTIYNLLLMIFDTREVAPAKTPPEVDVTAPVFVMVLVKVEVVAEPPTNVSTTPRTSPTIPTPADELLMTMVESVDGTVAVVKAAVVVAVAAPPPRRVPPTPTRPEPSVAITPRVRVPIGPNPRDRQATALQLVVVAVTSDRSADKTLVGIKLVAMDETSLAAVERSLTMLETTLAGRRLVAMAGTEVTPPASEVTSLTAAETTLLTRPVAAATRELATLAGRRLVGTASISETTDER